MLVSISLLVGVTAASLAPPAGQEYKQVQIAASPALVAATFAAGNRILFASSADSGKTWSNPVAVAEPGVLSAGRHRGPRVAFSGDALVISAVAGATGGGKDGDLQTFRSKDQGRTWHPAARINDVAGSAREGLHAMSSGPGGLLFAAWLDLRKAGTSLFGASSSDGGVTWSKNVEVYNPPSGTICQCCHPSVSIAADGAVTVMWRNVVAGNRDFYLATSKDGGKTFGAATKLGEGSWKLDACPMDGGGIAQTPDGKTLTVWRRETSVYLDQTGLPERKLHNGKDPSIAVTKLGTYVAWRDEKGIELVTPGSEQPTVLDPEGQYVELLALPSGSVLAAWERKGTIQFRLSETAH